LWDYTLDVTGPFADPDGDALVTAQWQISKDPAFTSLVLRRGIRTGTALTIPAGVLDPSSSYWVRTAHVDSAGSRSAWSDAAAFTTASSAPNDADGDGTDDQYQVNGFADSNGNDIDDGSEGICNLLEANTSKVTGFESDTGTVRCYRSVSSQSAPPLPDASMELPFGLFSFRIDGLPVNTADPSRVSVQVHLPAKPDGAVKWYKLDPATNKLTEYAGTVTFSGNTAMLQLTDGGSGDFDGIVNGVIVDPSGPAALPASSGGTSGSGSTGGSSGGGSLGLLLPALLAISALRPRRRGVRSL
jgi:hypothetical protein